MIRLEGAGLGAALTRCPAWLYDADRGGSISRRFEFANFRLAFLFMTQLAFIAEKHGHHPEWCNTYGRVDVTLTTHDANGLSTADIDFALAADKALNLFVTPSHVGSPGVRSRS